MPPDVGVTRTTFYNHFSSKDELVLEVLKQHDACWRGQFTDILRKFGGDSPRAQLLATADAVDFAVGSPGFNGCIFINAAVRFPIPDDPAHVAAVEHKRALESLIRQLAAYAGASDPAELMREICMILEWAYVSAQMGGSSDVTEPARGLFAAVVARHIPERETR